MSVKDFYKSMKPYMDIVDEIKASEMSKMNFMVWIIAEFGDARKVCIFAA